MRILFRLGIIFIFGLTLISCSSKNTAPDSEPVANPVISPQGGSYDEAIDVLIHCATEDAIIRYTTDGRDPTNQSSQYTGLLQLNANTLLKARAFKSGWIASSVVSAEFTFTSPAVANPVFNPPGGSYSEAISLSLSCATPGAAIHYTTDDSDPELNSLLYSAPLSISQPTTIKARAFWEGLIPSIIISESYSFNLPLPQFSPDSGDYPIAQMVSISCPISGTQIRYTTDGSEPSESSALYTHPLNVPINTLIKARAYKANWQPSEVASAYYIINLADQMQFVAGGTFHNGSSNVTISPFYIGKKEVTELEWVYIMVDTLEIDPELPETNNTWAAAIAYCNYRSFAEGYSPCYSYGGYGFIPAEWPADWGSAENHQRLACDWNASGYRLPTEMEWMFAARGGNQSHDYIFSGSDTIDDVAWFNGNTTEPVHVGTKAPNELGLYDMSGNLWEFCWDIYHNQYPSSDVSNPTGPTSGIMRVMRGGSWSTDATNATVSRRFYTLPDLAADAVGFRVVRKY